MLDTESKSNVELAFEYREKLIPFIGSGLSRSLGLPLWGELIESLSKIDGVDISQLRGRPGEKLEKIRGMVGTARFNSEISHQLSVDQNVCTKTLLVLGAAKPARIITTNLDCSLEETLKSFGTLPRILTKLDDDWLDQYLNSYDCPQVLKLHGTIELPESWVLTEEEYEKSYLENDLISKIFVHDSFIPIFIGFGFSDPDVEQMLRRFGWKTRKQHSVGFAILRNRIESLDRYGIRQIIVEDFDLYPEVLDAIYGNPAIPLQVSQTLSGHPLKLEIGPASICAKKIDKNKVEILTKIISNAIEPLSSSKILPEGTSRGSGPKKEYISMLGRNLNDKYLLQAALIGLSKFPDILFDEFLPILINDSAAVKKLLWPVLQGISNGFLSQNSSRTKQRFIKWIERYMNEPGITYAARKALANTLAISLNLHPAKSWPPAVAELDGLNALIYPLSEAQVAYLRGDINWQEKSIKPYILKSRSESLELVELMNSHYEKRKWRLPSAEDWLKLAGLKDNCCPPWPWGMAAPEPGIHAHLKFASTGGRIASEVVENGLFPRGTSEFGLIDLIGNAYELLRDQNGEFKLAGGAFTTVFDSKVDFEVIRKYLDEGEILKNKNNVCLRLVS